MRSLWLVMKHDLGVVLRQPSFWLVSFLVPVLLVALQIFLAIQEGGLSVGQSGEEEPATGGTEAEAFPELGLVDPAGLLARIPPSFPQDLFQPYPDVETARAAIEDGTIAQAVWIPEDYQATGTVVVYEKDFQILSGGQGMGVASFGDQGWILPYLINYNLTGDEQLVAALRNPTPGHLAAQHEVNPKPPQDAESQALATLVARVVPYVFYFLLLMSASYLMRSVVSEKENRTAEVLMVSLDARYMMVGKILAMSIVLLIQVAIWAVGSVLALNFGAGSLQVPPIGLPAGFAVWAVVFLLLGYLLFASIMAAAGALATNAREANQVIWVLVVPLMPTLMFGEMFLDQPVPPLVLALSLFPFSAPSAMVTRLAVAPVPLWQLGLSLVLLAVTTYAMVLLGARFFRAGNFLSEESFTWRRFFRGWGRPRTTA